MYELLSVLSWVSRAKTCYDLTRARTPTDVCFIATNCILMECLLYQAKQNIRNQYYLR